MTAMPNSETAKILIGKKVSKPLMEKKRRARINKCLDQLKSLLEICYSSNIRKRKLEKADILELTVRHLKQLQRSQGALPVNSPDFQAGFRSCLADVSHYLMMTDSVRHNGKRMVGQVGLQSPATLSNKDSSTTDSDIGTRYLAGIDAHRLLEDPDIQACRITTERFSGANSSTQTTGNHKRELVITDVSDTDSSPSPVQNDSAMKELQEIRDSGYLASGSKDDLPMHVMSYSDSYWRPW